MLEIVFGGGGGLCTCFLVNTCKQKISCLGKFLNQALGLGRVGRVFAETL